MAQAVFRLRLFNIINSRGLDCRTFPAIFSCAEILRLEDIKGFSLRHMCGPIEIFYFYMQGICLAALRHFGAEAVAYETLKRGRGGRKQKSFSLFCVCNRRGGFLQIIKAPALKPLPVRPLHSAQRIARRSGWQLQKQVYFNFYVFSSGNEEKNFRLHKKIF